MVLYLLIFTVGMAAGALFDMLFIKESANGRKKAGRIITGAATGIMWCITVAIVGLKPESGFICLVIPALIVIALIDERDRKIPFSAVVYIFSIGVLQLIPVIAAGSAGLAEEKWYGYMAGFFAVSVPLLVIYLATGGKGIGGGDIKLMAAAGLVLGWKYALIALTAGSLYGFVIHPVRMKAALSGRVFAFGPYLSAGIVTAMWFGKAVLEAVM